MRAVIVEQTGGPEVLTLVERESPLPGPGEVRVKVAAAGVNFIDTYQRSGLYPLPLPFVAGNEGAGTVDAVGAGVEGLTPGDRVAWAMVMGSGYAEEVVVPTDRLVPVPEGVELESAAAAMLQGMTAHFLTNTTFEAREHQTVLLTGAAGGVGLLMAQMLAAKGVRVIGTVGNPQKAELAKESGVSDIVLYREQDLVETVRELTGGAGVHAVYDGVGKDTFAAGLSLLRPRGMMVLFGGASGPVEPVDPQALNAAGSVYLTRPSLAHYAAERAELLWRSAEVLDAVGSGALRLRIGGRYGLDQAEQAHRDLEGGGTTGKLLLVP